MCTGSLPSENTKSNRLSRVTHTVPEHRVDLAVLSRLLYSLSFAFGPRCRLYILTCTGPNVRQSPLLEAGETKFLHSTGTDCVAAFGPAVRNCANASLFSEMSCEEVLDQSESLIEWTLPAGSASPPRRIVDAPSDKTLLLDAILSDRMEEPARDSDASSMRGSCSR